MPHIQSLDLTLEYGKFVLEPLERGYGQTIGNALRRVLLSSIPGAAVTAAKIDKVFHEFAPIPGVKEDVTEFLLNLKSLALRGDPDVLAAEDAAVKISLKGPGRVTGADIECPVGIEVMNPEVYLCTISEPNATLEMELFVSWGTGYMLPERYERHKGMIGLISTGSQFTPVRKVNYTVEQTRVGNRTDYERMVLEVWTNGAVAPNDAVTQAAHILDKYFRMFFDLGQADLMFDDAEVSLDDDDLKDVPDVKIEEMEFSQRTFNCLRRAGLITLRHLAAATESDLTGIRGFGKKSLTEVRDKLNQYGLQVKPPKGGYRAIDMLDDDEEDF